MRIIYLIIQSPRTKPRNSKFLADSNNITCATSHYHISIPVKKLLFRLGCCHNVEYVYHHEMLLL